MAQTIYRCDDGSEWATVEQAENNEQRVRLISDKLAELGGQEGLQQLIAKDGETGGFAYDYLDAYSDEALARTLAREMDEVVALAAVLKPILDQCGDNPYPLRY